MVVAGKVGNALQLTAVDAAAAKLGLYPGKALADARAMVPDIAVIRANAAADAALLESIADWCERYTPLVALDPPHGLFLDVTGVAHLFGGEAAMMKDVARAIGTQGFVVRIALAETAAASRALAHFAPGTRVAPGRAFEAVRPLPTEALDTTLQIVHALKRAGLKTIGQVAERTRHELMARFGSAFLTVLDRTLGRAGGPIAPRTPLPDLMAERRFAEPVVTEAVIDETVLSLAGNLSSILEERGQGARQVEVSVFHADGKRRHLVVQTGQPTRDAKVIARLFHERLDTLSNPLNSGFGFDLVRLSVHLAEDMQARTASLDANAADADMLFLIDQLTARFGGHRVLRFQPQDTHIPEAAAVAVPAQGGNGADSLWQMRDGTFTLCRPLRLFANPEPVDVQAEVPEGRPVQFRWRRVLHEVHRAEGPERIAMEWWRHREPQPTRDYYRVEDKVGRRFWLYRAGLYGRETAHPRWYMHGVFA